MPRNSSQTSSSPNDSRSQYSEASESIYRSPIMRKEALRDVYERSQALQSNVNVKTVEDLEEIIGEVDVINEEGTLDEKIKNEGEVYLDSEIMTISSDVLRKCTVSLSKDVNNYNPEEFAEKIKSYVSNIPDTIPLEDEPDWTLLGREIIKFFKRTPKFQMLSGTLQPIAKKEIVRRKYTKDAQVAVKKPETIIVNSKEEDSVEQSVEFILKIIKNYTKQHRKPLDYFELVLHPTDFGKTIENILHCSFLVKDNHIKFITDEQGVPQVIRTSRDEIEKLKKQKHLNQNVLALTMKQWRRLVQAYNITKPMIDLKK